ncbi:hypothetical protein CAEBREN_22229 [Caenorhabditis brenneri]|uniref:Uncharacterized protein n=1 Tax=Caenorhabditis brenneri TaxID=135651 RepID=G0M7T3_CAEBE|nr:hypothetical protein CAEBREN_22229 [Caenorhabditis brenneri]
MNRNEQFRGQKNDRTQPFYLFSYSCLL